MHAKVTQSKLGPRYKENLGKIELSASVFLPENEPSIVLIFEPHNFFSKTHFINEQKILFPTMK